ATGTATVRRRKLPAEWVVWIVIGMGLFRDRSIQEVVHHLDLVLPAKSGGTQRGIATSSAVVQARDRLGAAPLATLFEQTATCWAKASAHASRWRGLAVYGVDGSALRVADTPDNDQAFGRPGTSRGGAAGYPQLRLVALMVLRSHLLAGMSLGPWSAGETALAEPLWARLPDHSVTILDRGFLSYALLHRLATSGRERHWLIRAKSNLTWRTRRRLGPNDQLVEIAPSRPTRRAHPNYPRRSKSAPSATSAAASGPRPCSPRCSTQPPIPPPRLPSSTTSAGNSSSASTRSRPIPSSARRPF